SVSAVLFFFFSSRRRHTRFSRDWSSDVCSSDLADDLIGKLLASLLVDHVDRRAEDDAPAGVDSGDIDHLGVGELGLDLGNAALDEALLLPRGVVLGVLLQITVFACFRDRLNDARPGLGFEPMQLSPQLLRTSDGQRNLGHDAISLISLCRSCRRLTSCSSKYDSARQVARAPAMVVV